MLMIVVFTVSALVILREAGAPSRDRQDRSGYERDRLDKIFRSLGH